MSRIQCLSIIQPHSAVSDEPIDVDATRALIEQATVWERAFSAYAQAIGKTAQHERIIALSERHIIPKPADICACFVERGTDQLLAFIMETASQKRLQFLAVLSQVALSVRWKRELSVLQSIQTKVSMSLPVIHLHVTEGQEPAILNKQFDPLIANALGALS